MSFRGVISIFILLGSALLLTFGAIAWIPIGKVDGAVTPDFLFAMNLTAGSYALGWFGITLTFKNYALLAPVAAAKMEDETFFFSPDLALFSQIACFILCVTNQIRLSMSLESLIFPTVAVGYGWIVIIGVFFLPCPWRAPLGQYEFAEALTKGGIIWAMFFGVAESFSKGTAVPRFSWFGWFAISGVALVGFATAAVMVFAALRKPARAPSGAATPVTASPAIPSRHQPTSHMLYVVLGLFFGTFGVHNFLAGYTRKAVVQLLITICTFFIGAIFVIPWALIEICTVKEDADGVPFT